MDDETKITPPVITSGAADKDYTKIQSDHNEIIKEMTEQANRVNQISDTSPAKL